MAEQPPDTDAFAVVASREEGRHQVGPLPEVLTSDLDGGFGERYERVVDALSGR